MDWYFFDYVFIFCGLYFVKFFFIIKIVFYRKIKLVDVESVNVDLVELDLCCNLLDDFDEFVVCYDSILWVVMDKYVLV